MMIYLIDGKYYINTAPLKYTEVILSENNGDGLLTLTKNRIEINGDMRVVQVDFQNEIKKLASKSNYKNQDEEHSVRPMYNRRNKK